MTRESGNGAAPDTGPKPNGNGRREDERNNNGNKIDALILAYAEEKKRSSECLNRLQYLQADFDNYRKRVDRQIDDARKSSNERLILALLDVMDELELAIKNAKADDCASALVEGVEMTLKRLKKVLEGEGLTPIESVGKPFNPSMHSVSCTVEDDGTDEGTVLEEQRKGYLLNNKVIRPSMVKISVKGNSENKCDKDQEVKNNE